MIEPMVPAELDALVWGLWRVTAAFLDSQQQVAQASRERARERSEWVTSMGGGPRRRATEPSPCHPCWGRSRPGAHEGVRTG